MIPNPTADRAAPASGVVSLDALPGSAAVVNGEGVILEVNDAWRAFSERNGGDASRTGPGTSYLAVADHATSIGLLAVLQHEIDHYEADYPCHSPTEDAWFRVTITPMGDGALILHLNTTRDHQRLRRILDGAAGGIIEIGANGRASWVSEGWARLSGHDVSRPTRWLDVLSPETRAVISKAVDRAVRHDEAFTHDVRLLDRDSGDPRWVRLVGRPSDDGGSAALIVTALDVTDERLQQNKLAHLAYHDALTGLPNRSLFVEHLNAALAALSRPGGSRGIGVLFIDLDDFKQINDSHGHDVGDHALRLAAARCRSALRPGDIVARFGGDEFLALLEGVTPAQVRDVGERVRRLMAAPAQVGGARFQLSASVGAIHTELAVAADDLLGASDRALYAAKHGGKNRVHLVGPDDEAPFDDRDARR